MSKILTVELLGFPVAINNVPTTTEEAVVACGGGAVGEQKLVDKFVGFANAHHTYSDGRSDIIDAVEKATKITALTNADGEVTEKDSVYVARALAQSGKTVADVLAAIEVKDEHGAVISTGVSAITVDFNAGGSRRAGGGSKTPAKTYVDNATKIIANTPADVLTNIVAGLEKLNPAHKIALDAEGKPTADSLAAMLKANADRKRAEEKSELAALGAAV